MRWTLMLILLLCSQMGHAQYRCNEGGRSVFSDIPCGPDAKLVGRPYDSQAAAKDRPAVVNPPSPPADAQRTPYGNPSRAGRCTTAERDGQRLTVRDECR